MNCRTLRIGGLVFVMLAVGTIDGWSAELSQLLARLPDDANSLVIVNAEKAFASEVATKGGWKKSYEENFASSPLSMPPDSRMFISAARIDFEHMAPLWETIVVDLASDPSLDQVRQLTQGRDDEIAGMKTVLTPRGLYLAKFGPHLFGGRSPADRQATARWLRDVSAGQDSHLSPYLTSAASYTERVGTEIIMALDLADLLPPASVQSAMKASPVVKGSSVSPGDAARVLTSVQGITLGVRVTNRVFGALKIDTNMDPAAIKEIAKPLILEIIGEAGAMIDDLADWKVKVGTKGIVLEGELSEEGLRKVFSFLELEAAEVTAESDSGNGGSEGGSAGDGPDPYLSQQYFAAVSKYLKGLEREKGASSIGQIGLWFSKYARKIDRLPTLNVDPELVDYGLWVTEQLRAATAAIQGVGIRSGARTAQVSNDYTASGTSSNYGPVARYGTGYRVYGGGYSSWQVEANNVAAQKRAIRSEERATGATQARQIMQNVRNSQSDMRRKMTDKYKIQF